MIAEDSPNSPANRRHASARRKATHSWSPRAGPAVIAQRLDRQGHFAYSRRIAKRDSLAGYAAELARLGGKARAKKPTAEPRREIARKAERAPWIRSRKWEWSYPSEKMEEECAAVWSYPPGSTLSTKLFRCQA